MPDLIVTVKNNLEYQTYDALVDGRVLGNLAYFLEEDRVVLSYMFVHPEYRHKGMATAIIAGALNDIRAKEKTVTVLCTEVLQFLDAHPEYADLVSADDPGLS